MAKQKKNAAGTATMLDRWNAWIDEHPGPVLWIIIGVTLLFSLLLFNARISEGGDDSLYIEAGYRYSQDFTGYWYTQNAPGYPLFLTLPIALFGVNVILLKTLSTLFYLLGAILTWRTLAGRVQGVVLLPVLLLMGVNAYGQYFASQTYTEAFYFFVQAFLLWSFVRLIDRQDAITDLRRSWRSWLLMGFALLLCTIVRNIAMMAVPAVIGFFLLTKQWKAAGLSVISFVVFRVGWDALRNLIWTSKEQFSTQGNMLLQKDPYDVTKGNEDLAGFITRFFDNITIYMGKRFWEIIGVLQRDPAMTPETKGSYTFLALVLIALLVWALIVVLRRKDRTMLFLWCYAVCMMGGTFIALQTRWDQPRVILIVVPFLLILVLGAFTGLLNKGAMGSRVYLGLAGLLIVLSLVRSTKQAGENLPYLRENLKGDAYAGYTPDWVNFLKMSRWVADNLPEDKLVVSRKAPMSFIYGKGRKFYGVYKVMAMDPKTKQSNPDSALAIMKRDHVTHVMLASLRLQASVNNGRVINTIHNIMQPIAKKYPNKLRLVHQEGKTEPAYLYEILD